MSRICARSPAWRGSISCIAASTTIFWIRALSAAIRWSASAAFSPLGARGNVAIVNAPGCGVADDKVVYSYVPDIIRYYLSEEPLLPNVPTWRLDDKKTRDKVFARAAEYVFKPANESGGKGIVVGSRSTKRALEQAKRRIAADPRGYVAQPLISLSTSPTVCGRGVAPRRVDLRPFTVQTDRCFTTGGGLTRVARRAGSFIVNSSQGGGSKDTWIVQRAADS